MKTNFKIISTSIFFIGIYLFQLNSATAVSCIKPTPPPNNRCYSTVTTENQIDQDSKYIYIEKTTKQVDMNCGPSSDQIKYDADMVSYNTCLQINEMTKSRNALDDYDNSAKHLNSLKPANYYKKACPYPQQPADQISLQVTDTAGSILTEIKKYSNGTFAIFKINSGEYMGPATSNDFLNYKQYDKDTDSIYSMALGTHPDLSAWNGTTLMRQVKEDQDTRREYINSKEESLNKYFADSSNCPKPKLSCPENSTLSAEDGMCDCNYGYANNNNGGCETMDKWCLDIFGPLYYYDGSGNHIGACKIKDNVPITSKTATSKNIATKATTKKLNHTPVSSTTTSQTQLQNINHSSTTVNNIVQDNTKTWIKRTLEYFINLFND